MASEKGNVVSVVEKLAEPIVKNLNLELWDVEFVKEGASYFLRIFIDSEAGISIDDCEAVSRALDTVLDDADPIDKSYCLEVSSPGIERTLKKDSHFEKYLGKKIKTKLFRPDADGLKEFEGTLKSFENGAVQIETEEKTIIVKRSEAAYFKTVDDYEPLMEE
jgi:ribosome maturation factor RimP